MTAKIKILVVDDHRVLRSGLTMLLNSQSDVEVIGEAGCVSEARKKVATLQPDIILLDINLPDANGMEFAEELIGRSVPSKIIFLTMHDEPEYVSKVLQIGAAGYLLKSAADQDLLNAIRAVYTGEFVLHKGLRENVARQLHQQKQADYKRDKKAQDCAGNRMEKIDFTDRELEVLKYVALGHTHNEIAEMLYVSVKTVESHKAHIQEKMDTKKRSSIVKYALDHEIIKPGE